MLLTGQVVGKYMIVRLLGSGGLGAVYEATGVEHPEKRVALKTLHKEFSEHPEISARFRREANVGHRLVHPRIVSAIEYGYTESPENLAYMVMDLVSGESLKDYLVRMDGRLPESSCLHIFEQIADALVFAHENNVIHRDLKLGNVMVVGHPAPGELPSIKLLDFGIAKAVGPDFTDIQTADYKSIMGTFAYMPPEQFTTPAQVTGHSDVYSLGVMLYYCISGSLPFQAPAHTPPMQLASVYYKLHTSAIPAPLPVDINTKLSSLIMSMLAKNPSARPSMAIVQKALLGMRVSPRSNEAPTNFQNTADLPTRPSAGLGVESATPRAPTRSNGAGRERLLLVVAAVAILWALLATVVLLLRQR